MRFIGRSASSKPLATSADDDLQLGDTASPHKAEQLLGGKARLGRRKTENKARQQDAFEHLPNQEQKRLGKTLRTQEALLDTQQALLDNMPGTKGGPRLQVWPNTDMYNRSTNDLSSATPYQANRRPGVPPRRTSSNAVRDYYDPSRQPLYVSQQTSASAVRDMALRKGSPMIHDTASDPALATRSLKSAMKKQEVKREPVDLLRVRTNSSEKANEKKKPRRLDLSQFFPQPRAQPAHLLSPNKLSRSPAALTDTSELFPEETYQVQIKRPAANGRFETYKSVKPPSADSSSTTRPKVFEPDIFSQAKTNVRRPPKGIQNWFDGYEISSDEEEVAARPEPQELPANEALPSVFSPYMKPDHEQPRLNRKASKDPVEDNMLAIVHAKERMQERMRIANQRKDSIDSGTVASIVSSEVPSRKLPSRLATSRLASESVLSLSDSSGDEHARLSTIRDSVDDASTFASNAPSMPAEKPTGPALKLQNKRSIPRENFPRQSTSTVQTTQTSGTIPIRLTDSITTLNDPTPLPLAPKRNAQSSTKDPTTQALRKLEGQRDSTSQPSGSRRTTRASAQDTESNVTGETSSSMPMDAAHMMAVTEEEMALLEMMRNKRAAMQKNSFTEGYQLALKREQEHLVKRRESAQQTALKILRQKEEREKGQRGRESIEPVDANQHMSEQQRRKYSAIRREDVDNALKLERYLTETPLEDAFPEPPTANGTPVLERPPQKFELLLPQSYSPSPSKAADLSSPVSAADSSPIPEEEDIEDHHHRIRQFLAASGSSNGAGYFPTPPSTRHRVESRRDKRTHVLSPSPVAEEEPVPDGPERSRHRSSPPPEHRGRGASINGRRLSCHSDIDPLIDTASTVSTQPWQSSQTNDPYRLSANIDFSPFELSLHHMMASPSLSTSRASPLTPTFTNATPSERPTVEGACSSDNERSVRGRAYTPDTDLTSLSATTPKKHANAAAKRKPPRLDTIFGADRDERGSVASITSAGEDVLAAWAELGGGGEALASRRRVR